MPATINPEPEMSEGDGYERAHDDAMRRELTAGGRLEKSLEMPASLMGGESFIIKIEDVRAVTQAASAMLAALVDAELLARVNAPVTDGSPMHKAIVKAIAAAKAAGIKAES